MHRGNCFRKWHFLLPSTLYAKVKLGMNIKGNNKFSYLISLYINLKYRNFPFESVVYLNVDSNFLTFLLN